MATWASVKSDVRPSACLSRQACTQLLTKRQHRRGQRTSRLGLAGADTLVINAAVSSAIKGLFTAHELN